MSNGKAGGNLRGFYLVFAAVALIGIGTLGFNLASKAMGSAAMQPVDLEGAREDMRLLRDLAVGTFGGVVSLVDPTDSGNGRFRMLVVPDADDAPWPDDRWLRQGVRAKGWVLLDRVRLWYELWRQLNGFPPVISPEEPTRGSKKDETKKVPLPK